MSLPLIQSSHRLNKILSPALLDSSRFQNPAGAVSGFWLGSATWNLEFGIWNPVELGDDGRVVARADVREHRATSRLPGQGLAREDVIDTPADVALAHVAPRRPPREELVVVGIESTRQVHDSRGEDPLEDLTLLGPLPDDRRLALLGVNVPVGARDVQVPAENDLPARRADLADIRGHGLE